MAKIIKFNNKSYTIDDASFADATAVLKSHLSTVMLGEGATIKFDGIDYSIDSVKLDTAKNNLISHLGTIVGEGEKISINGVWYSVNSSTIGSIIVELEKVFGSLTSGDGSNLVEFNGDLTGWEQFDGSIFGADGSVLIKVSDSYTSPEQLKGATMTYRYGGSDILYVRTIESVEENFGPNGIKTVVFNPNECFEGVSQQDQVVFMSFYGDVYAEMGLPLDAGTYFVVYPEDEIYIMSISCITA